MSFRRVGGLAAVALGTVLWMSCGEVYRPVVIPIANTPPNSQNFHAVFGINTNVGVNPGTVLQIDVSGDSDIGIANMGLNPTHAGILPNNARVFVANAGSVNPGNVDFVTGFAPAADSTVATGIGSTVIYSLPNVGPQQSATIVSLSESGSIVTAVLSAPIGKAQVGGPINISGVSIGGYDGNFVISSINGANIQYSDSTTNLPATTGGLATVPIPTYCSYLPDFVTTAQNNMVFVANYGAENGANCNFGSTDSVAALNPGSLQIPNIVYLNPGNTAPAPHPVAMVETPNAQNLYVVNQGNDTVVDLSPVDLSTLATIPMPNTPVWAVARPDNQRVYVVTQGDGMLHTVRTDTNVLMSSQSVGGAGANFISYDPTLNRLYVANPVGGAVYVFSASTDPPTPLPVGTNGAISIPLPAQCVPATPCGPVVPTSVAPLPDGSRFYIASYTTQTVCSDPNVGADPCIIPMLTVYDAASLSVKSGASTLLAPSPSLSLLVSPPYALTQYALPPNASCVSPATYTPGTTRFRMFTTAAADSSHVYVSICDAGTIADVVTNSNTISAGSNAIDSLMTDIAAPFAACTPGTCGITSAITAFSIASNVVTFTAQNTFIPGERVEISGLGIGTYLNGQILTVLSNGLSGTQFECNVTHADVPLTTDSGAAVSIPSASITGFSINNNVTTFQAVNTFTAGTKVAISGLTSTAGKQLDGLTLIVLATGLSQTSFEAVSPTALTNASSTTDSGVAVPLVQTQSPVFLLTGQ